MAFPHRRGRGRPSEPGPAERARVTVDLSAPTGKVLPLAPVQSGAGWVQTDETPAQKAG
jgi:hypothetical protein